MAERRRDEEQRRAAARDDERAPSAEQRLPGLQAGIRSSYAKKLPPGSLAALQRAGGNAAVARLLAPQRATASVQRAIGLEIEVPIPVDDLTKKDIQNIQADAKLGWAQPYQHVKKAQYAQHIRAAANGFRAEVDHDNRVRTSTPGAPPVEGGDDSIMEIVFDPPAETVKDFKQTIANIQTFVNDVEQNTNGMTTRWDDPFGTGYSIGPLEYPPAKNARKAKHNWKGSVQVNIGIDPREYHSLMKWYAKSKYAKSRRARETAPGQEDAVQALFEEARKHIAKSVDVGRSVTQQIKKGIGGAAKLTAQDLADAGNLRGLRGWLTHVAFYLLRGTAGPAAGTPKNLAPVLLKSPPEVVNDYGLTAKEQAIFAASTQPIVDAILHGVGRGGEAGTAPNGITVWPHVPAMAGWTLDRIVDLHGKQVPLTGGPVKDPTGVGPQRTGNKAVKALKNVAPGPGIVGQGRGGVVAEYRMIPGYHEGPNAWKALGLDFLRAAIERNSRSGIST